jgi:hypothetical protein
MMPKKPVPLGKSLAFTHRDVAKRFCEGSPLKATEVTAGSGATVHVACASCGQKRKTQARYAVTHPRCSDCGVRDGHVTQRVRRTPLLESHPEAAALFSSDSPFGPQEVNAGSNRPVIVHCEICGETRLTSARKAAVRLRCRPCANRKEATLDQTHPELAARFCSDSPVNAAEVRSQDRGVLVKVRCPHCDAPEVIRVGTALGQKRCIRCFTPSGPFSKGERELQDFVDTLVEGQKRNWRRLLPDWKELDVYLPDLGLAIEYQGDYYHSHKLATARGERRRSKDHRWKMNMAERKGVAVAFVWESDWLSRRSEVEQAVREFIATGVVPPLLQRFVPLDEPAEFTVGAV